MKVNHTKGIWGVSHTSVHTREQVFHVTFKETPTDDEAKINAKLVDYLPHIVDALQTLIVTFDNGSGNQGAINYAKEVIKKINN